MTRGEATRYPSVAFRVDHADPGHVHFHVFVGKDPDHREGCGALVLERDEFRAVVDALGVTLLSPVPMETP